MVTRNVVLICGPPGAGKTTHAHTLDLPVYDLDDPRWNGSEKTFRRALDQLGRRPNAQAAVIRSGTTIAARRRTAHQIGATSTIILTTPLDVCIQRIIDRNRNRPPLRHQIAAAKAWWERYEPDPTPVARNW